MSRKLQTPGAEGNLTTLQPQKQRWCWAPLVWSCCLRGSFPWVSFLSFVFVGHFQQQHLKGTLLCWRRRHSGGLYKGSMPLESFQNTLSKPKDTTLQDISVSWTLINRFTNHDPLCIKTLFRSFFSITSYCKYKELVKISEFIITFAWQQQATPTWTSWSGSWGMVMQNV